MKKMRVGSLIILVLFVASILASCAPAAPAATQAVTTPGKLKVFGAYATPI